MNFCGILKFLNLDGKNAYIISNLHNIYKCLHRIFETWLEKLFHGAIVEERELDPRNQSDISALNSLLSQVCCLDVQGRRKV